MLHTLKPTTIMLGHNVSNFLDDKWQNAHVLKWNVSMFHLKFFLKEATPLSFQCNNCIIMSCIISLSLLWNCWSLNDCLCSLYKLSHPLTQSDQYHYLSYENTIGNSIDIVHSIRNMFFISLLIRTILLKTVIPSRYYFQSNFIEDIAYRSSDTWLDHSDLWWLLTIWQRTICSQLWFHWRYYRSSDTWLGHSDLSCLGSPSSDSGHPGPSHPRLHSQVTSLCHQCLWILWEVYIKPAWWWEVI